MPLFGEIRDSAVHLNYCGRTIEQAWLALPDHHSGVSLDVHVIMPNHFHGILRISEGTAGCAPTADIGRSLGKLAAGTLPVIIRSFKSATTRMIRQSLDIQHVWQRGYHEHVIRNESDLNLTRRYIAENPAKWTLDHENPNHVP